MAPMALLRAALDASWAIRRGVLGWLLLDVPGHNGTLDRLKSRTCHWWHLRSLRARIDEYDRELPFLERLDP